MSCQKNRGVSELLEHFEKTSSGNRINSSCRLIKELYLRVRNERNSTTKFSLISSTKLRSLPVTKRHQIESLLDEFHLELNITGVNSLDRGDESEMFINSKSIPNNIRLSSQSQKFTLVFAVKVFELLIHNSDISE